MKEYKSPELDIIAIDTQDVITTSGGGFSGSGSDSDDSEFGA